MVGRRLVSGAALTFGLLALVTLTSAAVWRGIIKSRAGSAAQPARAPDERKRDTQPAPAGAAPATREAASGGRGGPGLPLSLIELEEAFSREPVKGAPLSAEVEIESARRLPDGTEHVSRSRSLIYRDAEGRTRRDALQDPVVPQAAAAPPPSASYINDSAAGLAYTLDHMARTARRSPLKPEASRGVKQRRAPSAARNERRHPGLIAIETGSRDRPGTPATGEGDSGRQYDARQEELGQREVEGVTATGTRVVTTVPAGAAGNAQPFEIVTERWYSPELQTVLLFRRSDPRFGESVYRLTNVSRAAPAPSLFEVPREYRVIDSTAR